MSTVIGYKEFVAAAEMAVNIGMIDMNDPYTQRHYTGTKAYVAVINGWEKTYRGVNIIYTRPDMSAFDLSVWNMYSKKSNGQCIFIMDGIEVFNTNMWYAMSKDIARATSCASCSSIVGCYASNGNVVRNRMETVEGTPIRFLMIDPPEVISWNTRTVIDGELCKTLFTNNSGTFVKAFAANRHCIMASTSFEYKLKKEKCLVFFDNERFEKLVAVYEREG